MHYLEIASSIKNRRKILKITQSALSEMAGISLRSLKEIERGKGNPTINSLNKIADILGLEVIIGVKIINK
ncbi:hypothetical protein BH10BAC5_BH10BAC5_22210 [soil metagenome]